MTTTIYIGKNKNQLSASEAYNHIGVTDLEMSESKNYYRVWDILYGINMIIYKKCTEGRRLSRMIKKKPYFYTVNPIKTFLQEMAIKNIKPSLLLVHFGVALNKMYSRAQREKLNEIRTVLEIQ